MACNHILLKNTALVLLLAAGIATISLATSGKAQPVQAVVQEPVSSGITGKKKGFIKYAEFNVPYLALKKAMNLDIESHSKGGNLSWIDLLAYLAARYGGDFKRYKSADMDALVDQLQTKSLAEITGKMKYFSYYHEVYSAVLSGLLGKYKIDGEEKYGLIGFSPIAKTFPYSDCDDFGVRRTYGYSRPHLGHDMMSATGTPVIAVESGVVEALGWNQYGGWRIGIRSFDSKRYYYYAHLRQNRPYAAGLSLGKTVKAGDVIGYVGRTGYSSHENVNNIQISHLHFGLELIFDESQKECDNEIWIDVYPLTKLLRQNQSEVLRNAETKEFTRAHDIEIEQLPGSNE
ncbi:MAG: M23 family metallopeptidase [Oscillospiraceae bacterium]|nr:M23 family metallopeptidase [Oscillospiraceae bacterium]